MVRGLFIGIEHRDAWLQQKPAQDRFILRSLRPHSKSGAQFPYNNKRKPDLIGELNGFDDRPIATAKICIAVGIECQPHV